MDEAFLQWNPVADVEPFKTMIANGWEYRDFNKMLAEYWDELLSILGEGNYHLITIAEYPQPDGRIFKRGQMLINPTGFENVRKHVKTLAKKH